MKSVGIEQALRNANKNIAKMNAENERVLNEVAESQVQAKAFLASLKEKKNKK
jgi:hypothetical protein